MAVEHQDSSNKFKDLKDVNEVNLNGSNIMVPIDNQGRYTKTVQTHNAVSVAKDGISVGAWIDTEGFSEICITTMNDASTNSGGYLDYSNDGVSVHGKDVVNIIVTSTQQYKSGNNVIKSRYVRFVLWNNDATLAHTMSAWSYLKV